MTQPELDQSGIYLTEAQQTDADSVTLLRILDVLYAMLAKQDEVAFKAVVNKHREGGLIGPIVNFDPQELLDKNE